MTAILHDAEVPRPSAEARTGVDAWPSARTGYYAVFVFALSLMINFLDRGVVNLLVGPIERDLHLSDLQMSFVMGFAFVGFYMVLGFPIARLVDSRSRRLILGVGVTVWSVMTACCGLAQNFWQLFAARVGVGVGEACSGPATYSMLSDLFPKEKLPRAIAFLQFGTVAGMAGALFIGGSVVQALSGLSPVDVPVIGQIRGWQLTFFAVGIPGLIVALLMRTVPEPKRRGLGAEGQVADSVPISAVFGFLRQNGTTFAPLFVSMGLGTILLFGVQSWQPSFFIRTYGWSPAEYGLVAGSTLVLTMPFGAVFGGIFAERLAQKGYDDANLRVVLIAGALALPAAILYPLMPNATLSVALLALHGFVVAWGSAPLNAAFQIITPNRMRGQVTALYLFIFNVVGMGMGPTFVALFTDLVLHSHDKVGEAIALSAAIVSPINLVLMWFALKPYAESVRRARDWA